MGPSCLDLPKQWLPSEEDLPRLAHTLWELDGGKDFSQFYKDGPEFTCSHFLSLLLWRHSGWFSPIHVVLVPLSLFLASSPQIMLLKAAPRAFLVAALKCRSSGSTWWFRLCIILKSQVISVTENCDSLSCTISQRVPWDKCPDTRICAVQRDALLCYALSFIS